MPAEDVYRKLQIHLDRAPVGFPATESGVELRILRALFTEQEAELALELSAFPEPLSTVHKRVQHMQLDALRDALDAMAVKGTILRMEIEGEPRYVKRIFAVGFFEAQVGRLTPELAQDSEDYLLGGFANAFHTGKTTQMRVVPVNRAIPVDRQVAPYDRVVEFVRNSPGPFSKIPCICRQSKGVRGEPCHRAHEEESCLMVGVAAEFTINAGGPSISREEILRLLEQAERDGLVVQPENTQNPMFICCCCECCCGVLNSAKKLADPARFFSTSWVVRLNLEECQTCGACEERCPMDALSNVDGATHLESSRCIGCGLCVSVCPSGALTLEAKPGAAEPPADTKGLYMRLLKDRYGVTGLAKFVAMHVAGRKI